MEKLEPSCLSLENYFMLLMMPIIMDVRLLLLLLMGKELFQVEHKEKFVSGKLPNKLR